MEAGCPEGRPWRPHLQRPGRRQPPIGGPPGKRRGGRRGGHRRCSHGLREGGSHRERREDAVEAEADFHATVESPEVNECLRGKVLEGNGGAPGGPAGGGRELADLKHAMVREGNLPPRHEVKMPGGMGRDRNPVNSAARGAALKGVFGRGGAKTSPREDAQSRRS